MIFLEISEVVQLFLPISTFLAACAVLRTAATSSTKSSDLEAWQEEEVISLAMEQSTSHQLLPECIDKSLESSHVKLASFVF